MKFLAVTVEQAKTSVSKIYPIKSSFLNFFNSIDDIYGIDEVTFYNGEWEDKNYAVAGDVLDGVSIDLDSCTLLVQNDFIFTVPLRSIYESPGRKRCWK